MQPPPPRSEPPTGKAPPRPVRRRRPPPPPPRSAGTGPRAGALGSGGDAGRGSRRGGGRQRPSVRSGLGGGSNGPLGRAAAALVDPRARVPLLVAAVVALSISLPLLLTSEGGDEANVASEATAAADDTLTEPADGAGGESAVASGENSPAATGKASETESTRTGGPADGGDGGEPSEGGDDGRSPTPATQDPLVPPREPPQAPSAPPAESSPPPLLGPPAPSNPPPSSPDPPLAPEPDPPSALPPDPTPPTTAAPPPTTAAPPPPDLTPPTAVPPPTVTSPPAEPDWGEIARSVVKVVAEDCGAAGSGTVVVDGRHVLTNAHVVISDLGRDCYDVYVGLSERFEDEPTEWVRATAIAYEGDALDYTLLLDLAVLELERSSGRAAIPVAAQHLDPGEEIVTFGFPGVGGETMTLTRGVYSGMVGSGADSYIKTDADISPGNSGGAAFDGHGNFVGVPTAVSIPDEGFPEVGWLIPAAEAADFLARHVGD